MNKRKMILWAVVVVALVVLVAVFRNKVHFDWTMFWQQLRQGRLPLWTPQIMSGYPLLSMAQIGIGYPLTWFYLFLPGRFAETIYDLAPYLLFPIFSYCYLREVGRSRTADNRTPATKSVP